MLLHFHICWQPAALDQAAPPLAGQKSASLEGVVSAAAAAAGPPPLHLQQQKQQQDRHPCISSSIFCFARPHSFSP
jgi:hypothetical protein